MSSPHSIQTFSNPFESFSDSRKHGYIGPSRNVRLGRVTPLGGGLIAKNEDGMRCAVTGRESLRILRISEPSSTSNSDHKFSVGRGGHRIDASRNFWEGSGLKIDSASTDVAWARGQYTNKILTSARNGDLILWDLNKSGVTKYERRTKDHLRSINKISVSHIVTNYCITGSSDGDMRVWDIRDLSKSIMLVHHPTSVRSVIFSPSLWQPLQSIVGLDNGSIYRWDLKMGQRGLLDKLPVAHSASVTAFDWCCAGGLSSQSLAIAGVPDNAYTGLGWLASGSLDKTVKVWDLTALSSNAHIPHKPTYTLHTSFPVRRLAWRPGYPCEIAVVSNIEYAHSSVDSSQITMGGASSGLLTRVGSGVGLDTLRPMESAYANKDKIVSSEDVKNALTEASLGDAIEVWDVRREWMAKWSVTGSASEGSVTDIMFGDSHALWAQHVSGSFSQLDLRDASKPLDSITRVTSTWEASGSMAFVVDEGSQWEVPYDDIRPEPQTLSELSKLPNKALGDAPVQIKSQTIATYSRDLSICDLGMFTTLARDYIIEGRSRKDICVYNSGIAIAAGHETAAQAWLLLAACLEQNVPILPPTPPYSPLPKSKSSISPLFPLQMSPRPGSMSGFSFPMSANGRNAELSRSPSFRHPFSSARRSGSLSRTPGHIPSTSSASHKLTPTSSTSSSPRHLPISLPSVTPRRAYIFGRRDSLDTSVPVNSSLLRRSSNSGSLPQNASPSDRSTSSLRHVGEGVLDDSDSSDSNEGKVDGEDTAGVNSSDGELGPLVSSNLSAPRIFPNPSPLSRVAGAQPWSEDDDNSEEDIDNEDDDDSSPSPQSTETDSDGLCSPNKRSKSSKTARRNSTHIKLRSRSSTVASLAAPVSRPSLNHRDSQSSIRTVTVAETSFNRELEDSKEFGTSISQPAQQVVSEGHSRQKSQIISEFMNIGNKTIPPVELKGVTYYEDEDREVTQRWIEIIRFEDKRFRESTLSALMNTLEEFADKGDVQMCSMLSLVAAEELYISKRRVIRFLESYLEILTRLKLHTCAAYLRKFCGAQDIRNSTLLETTIYTSCGKCRKPLLLPTGTSRPKIFNQGAFSYCGVCQASVVTCSICRLPVRALLFQCSVCNHGGHHACYRQYYMHQPMVDLPTSMFPTNDSRGRTSRKLSQEDDSSSTTSGMVDASATQSPRQSIQLSYSLSGHPCAAGCGHFCWAANRNSEDS